MRTLEIAGHEVDFELFDEEGNIRKESLISDDLTADFIEDQITDGCSSGDLLETVITNSGVHIECTGTWKIRKIKEQV